jgi:hypothetical protein
MLTMSVVKEGQLKGAFRGFHNRDTLFEFREGGSWRQNEYRYQYQYAYMPHAKVIQDYGRYLLYVDGMPNPIEVVNVR